MARAMLPPPMPMPDDALMLPDMLGSVHTSATGGGGGGLGLRAGSAASSLCVVVVVVVVGAVVAAAVAAVPLGSRGPLCSDR